MKRKSAYGNTDVTSATGLVPTGTILFYGSATAPTGWLSCNGASVATSTYPALFAVVGYSFGGAGANFTLPDLRGRSPIGTGTGSGLTARALAASGGEEKHTILTAELASHSHTIQASTGNPNTDEITGAIFATQVADTYAIAASYNTDMAGTNTAGSGTAMNVMQPYLALGAIIKI